MTRVLVVGLLSVATLLAPGCLQDAIAPPGTTLFLWIDEDFRAVSSRDGHEIEPNEPWCIEAYYRSEEGDVFFPGHWKQTTPAGILLRRYVGFEGHDSPLDWSVTHDYAFDVDGDRLEVRSEVGGLLLFSLAIASGVVRVDGSPLVPGETMSRVFDYSAVQGNDRYTVHDEITLRNMGIVAATTPADPRGCY